MIRLFSYMANAANAPTQGRLNYPPVLVSNGLCVLHYDDEAGKGDHRHMQDSKTACTFTDPDAVRVDVTLRAA